MTVYDETQKAIAAAELTDKDAGAIATLLILARKIDTEAELRELALQYAAENGQKPPSVDNVSIPTYLKYAESLGLTPAGRNKVIKPAPPAKKEPEPEPEKEADDDHDNVSPFQQRRNRARAIRSAG